MAAKTPISIVSSVSISAKYVLTLCRGGVWGGRPPKAALPTSASFHAARITTGTSTAVMAMRTSAMPSTPTA